MNTSATPARRLLSEETRFSTTCAKQPEVRKKGQSSKEKIGQKGGKCWLSASTNSHNIRKSWESRRRAINSLSQKKKSAPTNDGVDGAAIRRHYSIDNIKGRAWTNNKHFQTDVHSSPYFGGQTDPRGFTQIIRGHCLGCAAGICF